MNVLSSSHATPPFPWLRHLPFALCVWAAFILRWGYVVGADDHYEFSASALLFAEPGVLANDLFFNSLRGLGISERTLFGGVMGALLPLGNGVWLVLHGLSFVATVLGVVRLGQLAGLRSLGAQYGVVFVSLFVLYNFNTGGTELAYNNFQSSSISDAAGVWALCLCLQRRLWGAVALLTVATAAQPLVGANLIVLCGAVWLWQATVLKTLKWKQILLAVAAWLATSGVWIALIRVGYQTDIAALSDAEFFHAMFRVRAPHHFLPSAFPLSGWLAMSCLTAAGLWVFGKMRHPLAAVLLALVGVGTIYTIGVEGFESFTLGSTQWFRATQWAKPIGLIAIALWLERQGWLSPPWRGRGWVFSLRPRWQAVAAVGTVACWVGIYSLNGIGPFAGKPYYLPGLMHRHPEYTIAQAAQALTPPDAVFVIPHSFTALPYWGHRAAYVTWKGVCRGRAPLREWLRRYEEVYLGTSPLLGGAGGPEVGSQQTPAPPEREDLPTAAPTWQHLRSEGVTHIIAPAGWQPPVQMRLLTQNAQYSLWAF